MVFYSSISAFDAFIFFYLDGLGPLKSLHLYCCSLQALLAFPFFQPPAYELQKMLSQPAPKIRLLRLIPLIKIFIFFYIPFPWRLFAGKVNVTCFTRQRYSFFFICCICNHSRHVVVDMFFWARYYDSRFHIFIKSKRA